MAVSDHRQNVLDTIVALADGIARASPDCADQALRIIELVHDLAGSVDQASVEDAIIAGTVDSDLSDPQVRTTARAVIEALRDRDGERE